MTGICHLYSITIFDTLIGFFVPDSWCHLKNKTLQYVFMKIIISSIHYVGNFKEEEIYAENDSLRTNLRDNLLSDRSG